MRRISIALVALAAVVTAAQADVCLVPQCYSSRRFGVDPAAYPRIAHIERACAELPAFQRAAPERQPDAVG